MVVDAFVAARHRIMPAGEEATHPVARTLGDARESIALVETPSASDGAAAGEVLAVASLAQAVSARRSSPTSAP